MDEFILITYNLCNEDTLAVVMYVHTYVGIRESVDSLCRDSTDTLIVRVHTKAF